MNKCTCIYEKIYVSDNDTDLYDCDAELIPYSRVEDINIDKTWCHENQISIDYLVYIQRIINSFRKNKIIKKVLALDFFKIDKETRDNISAKLEETRRKEIVDYGTCFDLYWIHDTFIDRKFIGELINAGFNRSRGPSERLWFKEHVYLSKDVSDNYYLDYAGIITFGRKREQRDLVAYTSCIRIDAEYIENKLTYRNMPYTTFFFDLLIETT